MCSRVCGMGPSAALTTRIAPSICVARAVDVRIVPLVRLVFHVADGDGHDLGRIPPPLALRGLRHFVVAHELRHPPLRADLGQRTRQRRLPRTMSASVTVGSMPPRSKAAGPGWAPALCGPASTE